MAYLVGDHIGIIHLVSSIVALISGTLVLSLNKGTGRHIKIGYLYVFSMLILNITALMIHRLFNGWGFFHYATIVSFATVALGMIPILTKFPEKYWRYLHFSGMYWSVIGLYAAFAAELLTRIPESPFFGMVGFATGIVVLAGVAFFVLKKEKWQEVLKSQS